MMISNLASHSKKSVECKCLFFLLQANSASVFRTMFFFNFYYIHANLYLFLSYNQWREKVNILPGLSADYWFVPRTCSKNKKMTFSVDVFSFQMVSNKVF